MRRKSSKGISVIEIIIASAVISLTVIAISLAYANFVSMSNENTAKVQAALLLDEGVEAIKLMRGDAWSNIASTTPATTYYLVWVQSSTGTPEWRATTTPVVIDQKFYRTFTVSEVYRDTVTFNILYDNTGTLDPGTKKIDFTIAWKEKEATTTRQTSMYIFNLYE